MPIRASDVRYAPTVLSYLTGAPRNWGPPAFFTVETINTCNLRCVYCPQSRPEEHFVNGRGRMSLEQFDRVLDRIVDAFHPRGISLHRDGEPLINKSIATYVGHATARGLRVSFSTNGTLLDRERAKGLLEAGLRSVNSDFSADAETYESLRVGAKWSRTRDGLFALLEVAEEMDAPLQVLIKDLAATDPTRARTQLLETERLFRAHAKRVRVIPAQFHNALQNSARDLSRPSHNGHYMLCHQPWVSMTVDWSGRVVGCCRDLRSEYVLGNILEQPPWEIWNGEPARRLRCALARRRPSDIHTCATCDMPWNGSYSGYTPLGRVANFMFSKTWKTS